MAAVQLVEYQSSWPSQFQQVADQLRSVLANAEGVIEHIGSTSAPGLCAKPVLDVALGVASLAAAESAIPTLALNGFVYRPDYETSIPDRRYFVRPPGPSPKVHLHAVVLGGALWRQHLYFRDRLRHDNPLRDAYASLKQTLAASHPADKAAYTEAKAPFIQAVLATCPTRSQAAGNHA